MAKKPEAPKKQNRADKADDALKTFISSLDKGLKASTGGNLQAFAKRVRSEGRAGVLNAVVCAAADAQKKL